jgi:hypothetical protein
MLLAWVSKSEGAESKTALLPSADSSRRSRGKRLELPLLKTDHEIDCKEFARREGFEIKLKDVKLPLEMIDDERDEGLEFPTGSWDRGAELIEELSREKLSVKKETLFYIQDALKIEWDGEVEKEVWASVQNYKRVS